MCAIAAAGRSRARGCPEHLVAHNRGTSRGSDPAFPRRARCARADSRSARARGGGNPAFPRRAWRVPVEHLTAGAAGMECPGASIAPPGPGPGNTSPARAQDSTARARLLSSGGGSRDTKTAAGQCAPARGVPSPRCPRCTGRSGGGAGGGGRERAVQQERLAAGLGLASRRTRSLAGRTTAPLIHVADERTSSCAGAPAGRGAACRLTGPRSRSHPRRAGRPAGPSRSRRAPRGPAAPRRAGCTQPPP